MVVVRFEHCHRVMILQCTGDEQLFRCELNLFYFCFSKITSGEKTLVFGIGLKMYKLFYSVIPSLTKLLRRN